MDEYTITNKPSMEAAIKAIRGLDFAKKWMIRITKASKKLSDQQRKTFFMWVGECGDEMRLTEAEMYAFFKENHILPIKYRHDPEFAKKADAFGRLKITSNSRDYSLAKAMILELLSIRHLDESMMGKVLNGIAIWAHHEGLNITIPPDKEMEWMCGLSTKKKKDKA